jgi:Ser/Thr protein kinase RdoA (MazF antagonist)
MNEFNTRFEGLNEAQKQARYQWLAEACLAHYPAAQGSIAFVAHNAGITYRIETAQGRFLLKIAQATGEGTVLAQPEAINAGFVWLDAIARETSLVVQQPIASKRGEFITAVGFEDLSEPFYCSLQRWLDGEHPRDPSPAQVYQIGAMMAQLHEHGSGWIQGKTPPAYRYDETLLNENFEIFARVKTLDILSEAEWANVEQGVERIRGLMSRLGSDAQVWGPIHSDIHQQNLLVVDGQICPIDFGALVLGHYGFEPGVTLYHLMYLPAENRQALVAGYRANRELVRLSQMDLEAFLCAAALANLAFNVELPDQRTSRLFIRNVREFAAIFCEKLVHSVPFALEHYDYIR